MSEDTTYRDDGEGAGSGHGTTRRTITASGRAVARLGRLIARVGTLLNLVTMGSGVRRIRKGTPRSDTAWSRIRSLELWAIASELRLPTVTMSGRRAWDRTPALLRGMLFGLVVIGVLAIVAVAVVGPVG